MTHINISVQGARTPYIEPSYSEQELDFIEERNFENLINNFYDELVRVTIDGNPVGLNTRQRTNLIQAGIIILKRREGRVRFILTQKALSLILKMDEEENQT